MRVGIDVGGTNTDAVLMDERRVIAWAKRPTTVDVGAGIAAALEAVLKDSRTSPAALKAVMIGTTHFTNALVERRDLLKVGILRLASPSSEALPPMIGWPLDLREAMGSQVFLLPGGYEFDGREIAPFDESKVRAAASEIRRRGLRAVAITSVFAPMNQAMEKRAAAIIESECPDVAITQSGQIGRIGLLERENAAIMNAALAMLSQKVVRSFGSALESLDITAPFYVSQNDGTLMSATSVERYPILTVGSGATNSIRGAAFLTGIQDAIVMDIGGTTTDIGVLTQGFPRESTMEVNIGGIRTNFRMPDLLPIGLGGGTHIHLDPSLYDADHLASQSYEIGPDSAGFRIVEEAHIFGGKALTASDIAVAAGLAQFGNPHLLPKLSNQVVNALVDRFRFLLEEGIDRMKTAQGDMPVIIVGGGSVLAPHVLRGASETIRPEHASVANAVGAAIAQVGGEVDRLFSYEKAGRNASLTVAREEALQQVVSAGAVPETARIIDIEEVALGYLPGETVRVRAKAVGELRLT